MNDLPLMWEWESDHIHLSKRGNGHRITEKVISTNIAAISDGGSSPSRSYHGNLMNHAKNEDYIF